MHNEIFNSAKIWTYQNEDVLADETWQWDIFTRNSKPMAFLDDIFHREPLKKKAWKAVGPDHWNNENEEILKRVLGDSRIKKIVLRRDDKLAVYASKLRADKTGGYIRKPLDDVPLRIAFSAYDGFIKYYDACYAYYDDFLQVNLQLQQLLSNITLSTVFYISFSIQQGQEVLRVSYEDLTADGPVGDAEMRKVLEFLRVDSRVLPPPLEMCVKQTTKPLSQGITNYKALQTAFQHYPPSSSFDR
jgi:LPS sulfotransferase NodH